MGYIWYSMSENAYRAYQEGKVPFSKLNKLTQSLIRVITNGNIEELASEYHHTSKYYNITYFYNKKIEQIVKENIDKVYEVLILNDNLLKLSLNYYWNKLNNQIGDNYFTTKYFKEKIGVGNDRYIYLMMNFISWFGNVYYSSNKPVLNWKYVDYNRKKRYQWWGLDFEEKYTEEIKRFRELCYFFIDRIKTLIKGEV
jgi:hypothetical protein